MRKKILIIALIAVFSVLLGTLKTDDTYAACKNGNGHFSVVQNTAITEFDGIGNYETYGTNWACGGSERATLFLVNDWWGWGYDYTFDLRVNIDVNSKYNYAELMGLVYWAKTTSQYQGADRVGLCLSSSCSSGSTGGGVFSRTDGRAMSTEIQRSGSGCGSSSSTGYWSTPCGSVGIYIDGTLLKSKLERNELVCQYTCSTMEDGWIKVWNNRRWSNGNGTYGSEGGNAMYLYVHIDRGWSTTFNGKVEASVSGATLKTDGKYYVDGSTVQVKFQHSLQRNNDGPAEYKSVNYRTYGYKNQSYSPANDYISKSSVSLYKNSSWTQVRDSGWMTKTLNPGDNVICESLGYYATLSDTGESNWTPKYACVTVYRQIYVGFDGQVVPTANGQTVGANKSESAADTVWVDANTAPLYFSHQLKSNMSGYPNAKTQYKTAKGTGLSAYSFSTKSSWTNSSITSTSFQEAYKSNDGSTIYVNANRSDTDISTYCQSLTYYSSVREDGGVRTGEATRTGCVKIRPYKTTFTGAIKIEVYKDGRWQTYNNGDSINFSGNSLPEDVQVRFTHTVTRSSGDQNTPNYAKETYIKTSLGSTSGYRQTASGSDPHGTAKAQTAYNLTKGQTATHKDEFTTKIYPEQTIKLCQKLEFRSQIWGADYTNGSVGEYCITLTKTQINCMDQDFGIKNAHNYLKMDIYKNGTSTGDAVTSGRRDTGTTTVTMWAKPEDDVRFKYTLCAAGELASQFTDKYVTTYDISSQSYGPANGSGYLFGNTLPKNQTSVTVGRSNSTPGTGPFASGSNFKYETTILSPSDDAGNDYRCVSTRSGFYVIPGIFPGNTADLNTCKSDNVGNVSDVGTVFSQTATWTDIWYSNGSVVSGHNGTTNAKVIGEVRVPYNYKTSITTTAAGGRIILGHSASFIVRLGISSRENKQVNGNTAYATYSKPTKTELVKIVIDPSVSSDKAKEFNDIINANEYVAGSGSTSLATILSGKIGYGTYSREDYTSTQVYDADTSQEVLRHTLSIPDNDSEMKVGTKVCYIAGIWPADSHDKGSANIDSSNQDVALNTDSNLWHISSASCFTVAKRPSMAILNADAYAPGGILGITNERKYKGTDNKMIFGSWDEYGLVAGVQGSSKGKIVGIASGASLYGGVKPYTDVVDKVCFFSDLTFTNAQCKSEDLGKLPVDSTTASYPGRIADQIIARYTSRNDPDAKLSGGSTINSIGKCVSDGNGGFVPDGNGNYKCLSNGARYVHVTGDAEYTAGVCVKAGSGGYSNTNVYDADGTMYINGNVIYGQVDEVTTRRAGGCYESTYSSMADVPQVIIIAKKIVIRENVTHLDAWLIADEISTCDNANPGAGNCNKTLTVNGPVITKKLNLLRTAGGDGVVDGFTTNGKPAEIFYLGPETYLWSYSQATRFSQATTTYQRELAPRY